MLLGLRGKLTAKRKAQLIPKGEVPTLSSKPLQVQAKELAEARGCGCGAP